MKGDVDLMKTFGGKQDVALFLKQRAVGGQNYLEALYCGQFQKLFQIGMTQGFAH